MGLMLTLWKLGGRSIYTFILIFCLSSFVNALRINLGQINLSQGIIHPFSLRTIACSTLIGLSLNFDCIRVNADVPSEQINGLKKGSLLPCKQQSNCISTSSIKSLEKYSRPWLIGGDAEKSWNDLKSTVSSSNEMKVAEVDDELHYLRAEAKSAVPPLGIDDIEFILNTKDGLVTYRSNSRELVYAGTQLIGDGGSNRNRLENIRRRLGWGEMGASNEEAEYFKEIGKTNFFQKIQLASQPAEINFLDESVPEVEPEK